MDGDTILNFEAGDIIDLSAIDANRKLSGNQAFTLGSCDEFSGAAGELIMRASTDSDGNAVTLVEGDVNGDGIAEFQLTLMGVHDLDETAFYL